MEGSKNGLLPTLNVLDPCLGGSKLSQRLNFTILSFLCQSHAQSLPKKMIPESIGVVMAKLRGLRYSNNQFWSKKTPLKRGVRNRVKLSASYILKRGPRGSLVASFSSGSHFFHT